MSCEILRGSIVGVLAKRPVCRIVKNGVNVCGPYAVATLLTEDREPFDVAIFEPYVAARLLHLSAGDTIELTGEPQPTTVCDGFWLIADCIRVLERARYVK